jgi:amidophosphoribosyltransferase
MPLFTVSVNSWAGCFVRRYWKRLDHDIKNTVFSFIPNTAEVAYYGMVEGVHKYIKKYQRDQLLNREDKITDEELTEVLAIAPRVEKLAIKDVKLRTFITNDADRGEMVAHVYDTTYGVIKAGTDTLVALDDSIVRGTTLKQSILKILDRLGPKTYCGCIIGPANPLPGLLRY